MKRKILCTCMAVLVAATGLLFMPMETQALSLQTTLSAEMALPEETITATVSLSSLVEAKSGAVSVSYPADMLEPVSGTWLLDGAIVDYDMTTAKGVFVFEKTTEVSGEVLELVFKVRRDTVEGTATVTCAPQFMDGEGEPIACEASTNELKVLSVPGKMNSIASIYQYVSGGKDNSSLNGLAEQNSAIYMYNGTLRTAFRIPATYQTDSADFSTIVLEGRSYPILERGIILGTPGKELTIDSPTKVSVKSGFGSKYWEYDEESGTVTYTALVKNLTKEMKETDYIARAYVKVESNGKEYVVYSDVSAAFNAQKLYDSTAAMFESQGLEPPTWFKDSSIDDGIIDLT